MKNLTPVLLAMILLTSCTSSAIEPISAQPIPMREAPLQVWSITPSWGPLNHSNYKISIYGLGFKEGAWAFVGDMPCVKVKVKSYRHIRCTVPSQREAGDYSVTVVNPNGDIAPIAYTEEQLQNLDEEDQGSDGLIYFYYVKPLQERIAEQRKKLGEHQK